MSRFFRVFLEASLLLTLLLWLPAHAQSPAPATANLHEIRAEGLKTLPETQIIALAQLEKGTPVGKSDLQAAADRLLQTGLFAKVSYTFQTRADGLTVTFQLEEAPRVPVYFDNIPWFSDSELGDAIRKKAPFFDGTLPEAGAVVDQATDAVKDLLASHQLNVTVEHQLLANPLAEGNVQEFHVEGAAFFIASVEFSDPAVSSSHVVQQQLADVQGKPFSRMTIDLFLSEQLRPFYLKQGFLRVKLGPPEIRLAGNPNQKLPDHLPIFVPVVTGSPYQWKGAEWHGNEMLSEFALNSLLGEKAGATADGEELEAGWDRIREQYGKKGYLDAKIDAKPTYDDAARTIAYAVSIEEGPAYHFGKLVLTGLSMEGEKRLTQAWPIQQGVLFDKSVFEEFISKLDTHPTKVFGDLPLHYEGVGHYLRTDPQ